MLLTQSIVDLSVVDLSVIIEARKDTDLLISLKGVIRKVRTTITGKGA